MIQTVSTPLAFNC